ncbi:MAG TPA: hypothetical protein VEN30_20765 [Paraburkholderia sp.]|nr:hypothetical protein [Paraburkholderia sp.]
MMRAALLMAVIAMIAAVGHYRFVRMMTVSRRIDLSMLHGRNFAPDMRRFAFQGDGRERLNRKAQHQQHDDEELAPVRHRSKV